MRTSRALAKQIIATYAGALYDAAQASDEVDGVSMQLDAVLRLVRGNGPLRDVLLDDAVPAERRTEVAREVFAGLNPALVDTLAIMAERGNVDLLSSVVERFAAIAEERRGIVEVCRQLRKVEPALRRAARVAVKTMS